MDSPTAEGDVDPEEYLVRRVDQYRAWYDGRARACKRGYLWIRSCTLAAAGMVTLLAGWSRAPRSAAAALSVVVLVATALESVLHLREQWKNYRFTEQHLDKERFLFLARAGPYRGLDRHQAFLRLVERVEWAIAAENSTTLSTMTLAPEIRANGGGAHHA